MTQEPLLPGIPVKKKKVAREEKIQLQVCKYIKTQYPNILFLCDIAAGLNLGFKWATITKASRSHRGLPDVYIFHAKTIRQYTKDDDVKMLADDIAQNKAIIHSVTMRFYVGLVLELKSGKTSIFKKDGTLRKQKAVRKRKKGPAEVFDHLEEQQKALKLLEEQGFMAKFAEGFDQARKIIDDYLRPA